MAAPAATPGARLAAGLLLLGRAAPRSPCCWPCWPCGRPLLPAELAVALGALGGRGARGGARRPLAAAPQPAAPSSGRWSDMPLNCASLHLRGRKNGLDNKVVLS